MLYLKVCITLSSHFDAITWFVPSWLIWRRNSSKMTPKSTTNITKSTTTMTFCLAYCEVYGEIHCEIGWFRYHNNLNMSMKHQRHAQQNVLRKGNNKILWLSFVQSLRFLMIQWPNSMITQKFPWFFFKENQEHSIKVLDTPKSSKNNFATVKKIISSNVATHPLFIW